MASLALLCIENAIGWHRCVVSNLGHEEGRYKDTGAAESKHYRVTVVARCSTRLLQGLEDDAGAQRRDDLGRGDSHVVDSEDYSGLVNFLILF